MAQPVLGIAGLAVNELLTMVGVRPGMAGGHSYGELIALCAAGVFSEADLLELSGIRADAILDAAGSDPGAMAAVGAAPSRIGELPGVVIANYNAPDQTVISGPTAAVEAAIAALNAAGAPARRLPVACAFHSPVVAAAAATMAGALSRRDIGVPAFPVYANSTGAPYSGPPDAVRSVLAGQVAEPVRFTEQIEAMYAAGARTFVEAGPGRVLTGLVDRILGDRPHTAVACDVPGENGLRRFVIALAELVRAGVPVDPEPLFSGRAAPVTGSPTRPRWTVDGHLVRTADGSPVPGGLRPATAAPRLSLGGPSPVPDRDNAITEFLRSTRELVAAQRDVMLGYLGAAPAAPAAYGPPPAVNGHTEQRQHPAPAKETEPAPAALGPAFTRPAGRAEIADAVLEVIAARTGYPLDMLGADLDLEADLSVDSIKRTEVIAALAERLGLAGASAGDSVMEELAQIKTIAGITDWFAERLDGEAATTGREAATTDGGAPTTDGEPGAPVPIEPAPAGRPRRFVVETVGLAPAAAGPAPDGRFLIVDDGRGVALELAELLEQRGAEAVTTEAPTTKELAAADALVHLGSLRPGARPVLPSGFEPVRDALTAGARTVLVVTAAGGTFGLGREPDGGDPGDLGLRGLMRTIAAEYPRVLARAVDVEPKESPRVLAAQLLAELTDRSGPPVVGYRAGGRAGLRLVESAAPAPSAGTGLDQESVVLLTGGARGITASVALALARSAGCHIELIGRTPPPGPADPEIAGVASPAEVRRILIGRGLSSPREIEAAVARNQREQEVRATLEALRAASASVRYHAVDVRDGAAVGVLMDDIYARYGRLDGVIHGAGVLEDRLVPDKTAESFARVYETKVDGARALIAGLRGDVRFVVLFGSVSGVFGNRGQVDYSAANDALDTLAHASSRRSGRVIAVDWGPWAGGGMVSPELEREYARRGVTLIDPGEGVACLLAEIAAESGPAQVVYMCDEASGE
jgi:NADP-dependent 3-hydroxy acid dehydrogenase YdfG